jgi:hypothetical protein
LQHETIPVTDLEGRSDVHRANVTLLCEIRQGTRPWSLVRLEDISQTGFRVAWFPNCALDRPIRVRIPGLQVLSANIRWQRGKALGCAFGEPLHVAVFEHIVRQSVIDGPLG